MSRRWHVRLLHIPLPHSPRRGRFREVQSLSNIVKFSWAGIMGNVYTELSGCDPQFRRRMAATCQKSLLLKKYHEEVEVEIIIRCPTRNFRFSSTPEARTSRVDVCPPSCPPASCMERLTAGRRTRTRSFTSWIQVTYVGCRDLGRPGSPPCHQTNRRNRP